MPQNKAAFVLSELKPETPRVCSACYNRISRKVTSLLGENASASDMNAASPGSQLLRWSDEEQEALKRGIREYGSKWSDVAQYISAKTSHQCKNFFFNYKKKLGLDLILQEYNRVSLTRCSSVTSKSFLPVIKSNFSLSI